MGLAQLLLDRGADLNALDKTARSPLHRAAWLGSPNITAWLLAQGATILARDVDGKTPLDLAIEHNYEPVLDVFRTANLKVAARYYGNHTHLD